jgi:hypothetical protein
MNHMRRNEGLFHTSKNGPDPRMIGLLSLPVRYVKIMRFKQKKNSRIWTKQISYACRKNIAEKRLRIKGRFIKKEEQQSLLTELFGSVEILTENA